MAGEVGAITERVRERVRRDGVDLHADRRVAERYVRDEVQRSAELALAGAGPLLTDEAGIARQVLAALTGLGPLQPYLDDPTVEELWINAPDRIFVARDGVSERVPLVLTAGEVRELLERMLHQTGRRIDLSSPFVDASLPDGSRLHAVIPDVTRQHISINIRRFRSGMRGLDDLVRLGTLSRSAADFLAASVRAGLNILVTGATHTGKTTLLGALLGECRSDERVVTVEETFELSVPTADHVAMQCRQPSLEGTGEITLRRLIKESLRMRPDRLIVGEVREAESLDLLIALNAGIPGMCSLHAGSAREALIKLCTLPLLAGRNIDVSFVTPTVASSIDLVVHAELHRDGRRRVVEIIAPTGKVVDGIVEADTVFRLTDAGLEPTGDLPARTEPFERAGIDLRVLTTRPAEAMPQELASPALVPRTPDPMGAVSWDAVR
ncbi:ATPase, T2SS/T4P/T4SS family [Salinibacterium sp. ZJ77]|uniref:CpaF family protein n=1 Tax=Salinibacterium sp. ZJ77 TaxID=2708337 RepID=UPI001422679B|nr:ATPase, T2SS/T4P/T4SS family [Salinibacterium sp. ZJ77]